jgi:hypothetical protein
VKLIQVSDMHIKNDTDIPKIKVIIEKMVESIKKYIDDSDDKDKDDKEEIIFCVLGDIIDRGKSNAFSKAKEIFKIIKEYFKDGFPNSPFSFEFVPGNHDLVGCKKVCRLVKFDEFIQEFQSPPHYGYSSGNFFIREHGNINLLLLNSAIENCEYGKIDFKAFKEEFKKPTIIITHHALMSMYDSDNSAIRKGNDILKEIQKNNIIAMLHGHAHGYFYTDVGLTGKCIIGVGPFLKEVEVPDVYKQFNIFDIRGSSIFEIKNFTYRADPIGEFLSSMEPTRPRQNNFSGSSIREVYNDVVTATKDIGIIRNLRMHLNCKYDVFKEDINKHFKEYIEQAQEWQADQVNEKWYFNHGVRMQCKDKGKYKDGLDYIIKELMKKPLSSRAIIPLMNLDDVIDYASDDNKYLPSLINIQFAFGKKNPSTLFATIYMRSLEAANFLRINLCEVYNMCERITKELRDIEKIDLNIFAFRTVYKPHFGCFKKAELDRMGMERTRYNKLLSIIQKKNINEIVKLLEEKRNLGETKIIVNGISALKDAIEYEENAKIYTPRVSELIEKLLDAINKLKDKRSNYSVNEVDKEEKKVNKCLDELIEEFKKNE